MKDNKVMNDDDLYVIFREIGDEYLFKKIDVAFSPFTDFKITWEIDNRYPKKAKFRVSDYLIGSDANVLYVLGDIMFKRALGIYTGIGYGDLVNKELMSAEFLDRNKKIYLERHEAEDEPFTHIRGVDVYWSNNKMYTVAEISSVMNIIILNSKLRYAPQEIINTIIKLKYNAIQDGRMHFNCDPVFEKIDEDDEYNTKQWLINHNVRFNPEFC